MVAAPFDDECILSVIQRKTFTVEQKLRKPQKFSPSNVLPYTVII